MFPGDCHRLQHQNFTAVLGTETGCFQGYLRNDNMGRVRRGRRVEGGEKCVEKGGRHKGRKREKSFFNIFLQMNYSKIFRKQFFEIMVHPRSFMDQWNNESGETSRYHLLALINQGLPGPKREGEEEKGKDTSKGLCMGHKYSRLEEAKFCLPGLQLHFLWAGLSLSV